MKSISYLLRKCLVRESCCCLKFVGAIVTRTCLALMVLWSILVNPCPMIRLHICSGYCMHAFLTSDACLVELWHNSHLASFFTVSPLFSDHGSTPLSSFGYSRASRPLAYLLKALQAVGVATSFYFSVY
jgi:hypothetical protein